MKGILESVGESTVWFDSLAQMNTYILDSQYGLGADKPFLCYGIEMMEDVNQ
jgi:hypothetical protein